MKISANSIKAKNILIHNDELWVVSKMPEHTKPGKGPAYVQVEMKNLKTGTKLNTRFSSTDYIERAQLEQRQCQYLYEEDSKLVFMDNENFEQIYLEKDIMGDSLPFLQDGMMVQVEFHNNEPLSVELPQTIVAEIVETDPVIRGATVTSSFKPAILDNGIKVMVPSYITTGEKIVVKTEDKSFVERSKN